MTVPERTTCDVIGYDDDGRRHLVVSHALGCTGWVDDLDAYRWRLVYHYANGKTWDWGQRNVYRGAP